MSLKLLVGLGNPEPRYEKTRHNAGFMFLDQYATKYGATFSNSKNMQAHVCKFRALGHDLILAKPTTYMNLSGQAVASILNFYKIEKSNLMVIHDEVALNLGRIRLARGGGSAGNHGIESIMACIGSKEFNRLRLGVGPDPGGAIRADYVLSNFPAEQQELLMKVLAVSTEAAETWLLHGIQEAMNKYNGWNGEPPVDNPPTPTDGSGI